MEFIRSKDSINKHIKTKNLVIPLILGQHLMFVIKNLFHHLLVRNELNFLFLDEIERFKFPK